MAQLPREIKFVIPKPIDLNRVKTKLLIRGFTPEQLLNNRGLIGAILEEITLDLYLNNDE